MNFKYIILTFLLLFGLNGYSQISSSIAYYSEATEYSDSDLVFVFCTENVNGGALVALDSTGYGGYDYKWYKFNTGDLDFTDELTVFSINSDSTSSTITNLTTGGYKVILTNADTTQEYVAWVFNNVGRSVEIQFDQNNDCDFLWMQTEPYLQRNQIFDTDLNYYDTISGEFTLFRNRIEQYVWESDPDEDDFRKNNAPFASIVEDPFDNESELPTENTIFSVIVTDRFGCTVEDDIDYTAIETDADFSWNTVDYKTGEDLESGNGSSDLTGSAPLRVRFTNESKNGQDYIWFFGDTLWSNDIDSIKTTDELLEPEHTYYYVFPTDTGKIYTMKLYSESEYGCKDSIHFKINMLPFKMELPNVFTPNRDDINDIFTLQEGYQSIRNFKITIFNRVGQVVHEYEGGISDWEGWDGKVRNSNRDATEGNYFFVVEVTGWDNVFYDNKNLNVTSGTEENPPKNEQFGIIRLFR